MNGVREDTLEQITAVLLAMLPLLKKKLFRGDGTDENRGIIHSQTHILILLQQQKAMPISEIGKQLLISPSNMTPLIDKLIDEDLVVRRPDKKDRRVINVAITRRGLEHLEALKKARMDSFKTKLSNLSDDDLSLLLSSLQNILKVVAKVDAEH